MLRKRNQNKLYWADSKYRIWVNDDIVRLPGRYGPTATLGCLRSSAYLWRQMSHIELPDIWQHITTYCPRNRKFEQQIG